MTIPSLQLVAVLLLLLGMDGVLAHKRHSTLYEGAPLPPYEGFLLNFSSPVPPTSYPPHSRCTWGVQAQLECPRGVGPGIEVEFLIDGGLFNQVYSILSALWLLDRLGAYLDLQNASYHVVLPLPALHRSFPSAQRVPFGAVFNVTHLQLRIARSHLTLREKAVGEPLCPHRAMIGPRVVTRYRSPHRTVVRHVASVLRNWTRHGGAEPFLHPCVFLRFDFFRLTQMAFFRMFRAGIPFLRFTYAYQKVAAEAVAQIRALSGGPTRAFVGLHLRIERDMFKLSQCRYNVSNVERCLWMAASGSNGSGISRRPVVYVAVGSSALALPEFQRWRRHSGFHVLTKHDVYATAAVAARLSPPLERGSSSSSSLGREQWAALEALVLMQAGVFLGSHLSTLSIVVSQLRQWQMPLQARADFMWTLRCGGCLRRTRWK